MRYFAYERPRPRGLAVTMIALGLVGAISGRAQDQNSPSDNSSQGGWRRFGDSTPPSTTLPPTTVSQSPQSTIPSYPRQTTASSYPQQTQQSSAYPQQSYPPQTVSPAYPQEAQSAGQYNPGHPQGSEQNLPPANAGNYDPNYQQGNGQPPPPPAGGYDPAYQQSGGQTAPPPPQYNPQYGPQARSGQMANGQPVDVYANPMPVPPTLVIPGNAWVTVRINQPISSDRNQPGDAFTGTLMEPIIVNGLVVARRGATVAGRVAEVQKAGHVSGTSRLGLELTELGIVDGQQVPLQTQLVGRRGPTSVGSDVAAIGTTTGIGAAIGAAAAGGFGAGMGAIAGAGAATIGVLATRGHATYVGPESVLTFRIANPITVVTERSQAAFLPVSQQDYSSQQMSSPGLQRRPGPYMAGPGAPYAGYGYGYPGYYPYSYGYGYGYGFGPSFFFYSGRGYYGGGRYYGRR